MTRATDSTAGSPAARPERTTPRRVGAGLAFAVLAGLLASPAFANAPVRILSVEVARGSSVFSITMRMALRASAHAVFAALQDYRAMPRYNPDLRYVRVEPTRHPDQVRLFTTVHACVLVFCRTLHQEQVVTASAEAHGGTVRAVLMPGGSFRSGSAQWTVRPCVRHRGQSCLDVHIALEPAFWVPPLIGPWILRHKMYQEALRSGIGLAQVADRLETPRSGQPPR